MDGSITRITLSDGSTRYRPRYRDPGGRQHEKRFPRKVDAQPAEVEGLADAAGDDEDMVRLLAYRGRASAS